MNKVIVFFISILCTTFVFGQRRDLNYYISQAEQNSPLLNKNKADSQLIELDYKQAERVLSCPQVNLESNILFAPIISHDNNVNRFQLVSPGATNYTGFDQAVTDGGDFQAFVAVNQPLFKGNALKAHLQKKNISDEINKNKIVLTKHEITQLVGYQFILCEKSKLQIDNNDSIAKQVDGQLQVLQKLVQRGVYKQTDLMLLQIEQQNLEMTAKTLVADYRSNLYDLNSLCGINETKIEDIQPGKIQMNPGFHHRSPFLESYRLDSMNLMSDQALSELKYQPQLSAFANAGMVATYLPSLNRLGLSAGLTFSWNIFDGRQRRIERQRTEVNVSTLNFEKNHFMTQQQINKAKIIDQMKSLNDRILLLNDQLKKYNELITAYQKELSEGLVSVMDLKNLLKEASAKRQVKVMLDMENQLLINAYNYWNY